MAGIYCCHAGRLTVIDDYNLLGIRLLPSKVVLTDEQIRNPVR
jgi:hypothetical protein